MGEDAGVRSQPISPELKLLTSYFQISGWICQICFPPQWKGQVLQTCLSRGYFAPWSGGILQLPFISCSSKGLSWTRSAPQLDSANTPKADRGITKTATDPIMVALVMGFGSFFQNASSGVVTSLFIGLPFDWDWIVNGDLDFITVIPCIDLVVSLVVSQTPRLTLLIGVGIGAYLRCWLQPSWLHF